MADQTIWTIGTALPGLVGEWSSFSQPPQTSHDILLFNNAEMQILTASNRQLHLDWQKFILDELVKDRLVVVFLNMFELDEEANWHNFSFLPPQASHLAPYDGRDLQLSPHPVLKPFWEKMSPYLHCSCAFTQPLPIPFAKLKSTGQVAAGALKISRGTLVLLPEINWRHPHLFEAGEWSTEALSLGPWLQAYLRKASPHFKALK